MEKKLARQNFVCSQNFETKNCKMLRRNKNLVAIIWKQKIIKNFTSKSCKQNLWEIKKIENKIYLKKQLLGTKITKICTEEFKKEKQPRGYIHNFFGGKVG